MKKLQKNNCISVAIVSKGMEKRVINLLSDISRQKYLPTEVIFIESIKSGKYFCTKSIKKVLNNQKIKVIYKEVEFENIPKSRNLAMKFVSNEWFVFIDNDVRVDVSFLKNINICINKFPKAFGIVGEIKPLVSSYISDYSAYVFSRGFTNSDRDREIDFYSMMATTLNLKLIKKNKFKFDEELKTGEDTDFFLTAYENKLKSYYCPKLVVRHGFETKDWLKSVKKYFIYGRYFIQIEQRHPKYFVIPCFFPKNRIQWLLGLFYFVVFLIKITNYVPRRFLLISWMSHVSMMLGVYSSEDGKNRLKNNFINVWL